MKSHIEMTEILAEGFGFVVTVGLFLALAVLATEDDELAEGEEDQKLA